MWRKRWEGGLVSLTHSMRNDATNISCHSRLLRYCRRIGLLVPGKDVEQRSEQECYKTLDQNHQNKKAQVARNATVTSSNGTVSKALAAMERPVN